MELNSMFQQVEDTLNDAYESNDVSLISGLLADQWIILESATGLSQKDKFIQAIAEGRLVQRKMKKTVQVVKVYGTIAIVVSRGTSAGEYSGVSYNSEQWVTNIFSRQEAGWICLMTQEMPVICQ